MQILWWEHMRGEQMEDRFYMEEGEEEDQSWQLLSGHYWWKWVKPLTGSSGSTQWLLEIGSPNFELWSSFRVSSSVELELVNTQLDKFASLIEFLFFGNNK